MSSYTFILISGSWHSSQCWQRVIPLLETQGHRALAPELRGMGTDHTPLAHIQLIDWVDQVVDIVQQQQQKPVVLVGHSRGGFIISAVAQRIPDQIKLLVYLAAFLVPSGVTLYSLAEEATELKKAIVPHSNGTLTLKSDRIIHLFYNTTPAEWTQHVSSLICPEPGIIFKTLLQLTEDRFERVPRVYIECRRDNALPLVMQRSMYNRLPCRYVISMDTDHSPFFSAPVELVANLLDLAARK